nr:hypothetical protein [Candidatus Levybacteria bacterium]
MAGISESDSARAREIREALMKGFIDGAIDRGNSLINPDHPYVIIGQDPFDYNMFPMGSAADLESVSELARKKMEEDEIDNPSLFAMHTDIGIYDRRGRRLMPVQKPPTEIN